MSATRNFKRIKNMMERSRLESKEEGKLETTYDKIISKISPIISGGDYTFLTDHKDTNPNYNLVKRVQIARIKTTADGTVPLKFIEFHITPAIEHNFLHPENDKIDMVMSVYGLRYMETAKEIAVRLGKILNVKVYPELEGLNAKRIDALSIPRH